MRLALGTVQFGVSYGAFNSGGQVPKSDVAAILDRAAKAGIDTLDTAHAYGASEQVLGELGAAERFGIVTKVPALEGRGPEAIADVAAESLARLRTTKVHGVLMHDAADLLGPDGDRAWAALEKLKADRAANRIGLSVYDPEQAEQALDRYPIGIVQLPYSVFDQRFAQAGTLDRLKQAGVEVHARSIFLQGFALADPAAVPDRLKPLLPALERMRGAAEEAGLTPLAFALGFARDTAAIDRLVLGVENLAQLEQIIHAWQTPPSASGGEELAVAEPLLLNPSNWN